MKNRLLLIALLALLGNFQTQSAAPVTATEWAKSDLDARMQWFAHDRFGMFIHWGVYAVLGGEWQGKPTVWKNVRWTGVLERRDGEWVIAQMHFSFASDAASADAGDETSESR